MENDHQHSFDMINSLQQTELFECLDDDACGLVSKLVKWKKYKKGAEVIPYKGEGNDVYLIGSGRVRVTIYSLTGKEISYQDLGPGKIFGELSAIDQLPRTASVIALESSSVGVISRNDYWKLIAEYPGIAAATMKKLAGMVRFLTDRVYQYGALDVKDRVRTEVLRLARENMSDDDIAAIHDFPTHREIANRVNTHREAVTRELNKLTRMGLIEQSQRVLTVTSVQHLQQLLPEDI